MKKEENIYKEEHLLGHNKDALESILLEAEALKRGMTTFRVGISLFQSYIGSPTSPSLSFRSSASNLVSKAGVSACVNKSFTRAFVQRSNVNIPQGRRFGKKAQKDAISYAELIGWPVVVKPIDGDGGYGVTTNITTADELVTAMSAISGVIMLEQHVKGDDYRLTVVGGKVVAAAKRIPAHVVGDGKTSISDLIDRKNISRETNPHLDSRLIAKDETSSAMLKRIGFTLESVPTLGQHVRLRGPCNLSQGGDSLDVTDELHPSIASMAETAALYMPGIEQCGVDFLIEDHTLSADVQSVYLCEINSTPGVSLHHYPVYGLPRNVAGSIFEYAYIRSGLRGGHSNLSDHIEVDLDISGTWSEEIHRSLIKYAKKVNILFEVSPSRSGAAGCISGNVINVASFINYISRYGYGGEIISVTSTPRIK